MRYKLKKDFMNLKAGHIFNDYRYSNDASAEFSLERVSEHFAGETISLTCSKHPDLFEEVPLTDDEVIKKFKSSIDYDIIRPLKEFENHSSILIGGIESRVFREYVESVLSILKEVIDNAQTIDVKR